MAKGFGNCKHLIFALSFIFFQIHIEAKAFGSVYIVYMGETQHEDPELTKKSHYDMLSNFLGSEQEARSSMVYSYKHGFSGFAARLTENQAEKIAELPGVIKVFPNGLHKLQTTRSWDYLGLDYHDSNDISMKSNMGSDTIIGVIDSGIWPESESFSDKGMGPVPSHWKGICQEAHDFNASNCNKKLIGARWSYSGPPSIKQNFSPRDDPKGHGTHTASTAAGNFVEGASYGKLAFGKARGGAPHARLAVYKACWENPGCPDADIAEAFEKAIHDGVHIISLSVSDSVPPYNEPYQCNAISIFSFHAIARGITVVASGGNEGPYSGTISNTAPWLLTVAASTIDRVFPTPITLGNNITLLGQSLASQTFKEEFTGLVYWGREEVVNVTLAAGKVVLIFSGLDAAIINAVSVAGGTGILHAVEPDNIIQPCDTIQCIKVDYKVGMDILSYYLKERSSSIVKLGNPKTTIGKVVSPRVATFSSRGPSSLSPSVLKPDITAPGVAILAAFPPLSRRGKGGFALMDGTSMSCPHVAGIAALIKSLHPDWSPAAIKSALVTTASQTATNGDKINANGASRKPADPFDIGGGHVDPNKAANPGLVYNLSQHEYAQFLCSMGYTNTDIRIMFLNATVSTVCTKRSRHSGLDLNLPSISIPNLKKTVTVSRTVTNVGPINSVYKAVVESPNGVNMKVKPNMLIFNATIKELQYKVKFSSTEKIHGDYNFGSLTWKDNEHSVRIPIAVRHIMFHSYTDM